MAKTVERDWVVEAGDKLVVGSDEALASIVSRLPATPLLHVADVAAALDISTSQVHNWIDEGDFQCFAVGKSGKSGKRKHRRIVRVSFLEFLRKSIA